MIYDVKVKDADGNETSMDEFKGKVLLIVNTATKCGLTPQYEGLQDLYDEFNQKGFEILDFPSNQFMRQAPGTDSEIGEFCNMNYGTTFRRFAKADVNGKNASELFVWLKEQIKEDEGDDESRSFDKKTKMLKPFAKTGDIKWNFGKFLVDRDGNVVGRYSPGYVPEKLRERIEALL